MARRLLALFLSFVMVFSFAVSAYAESNVSNDDTSYYEFDDVTDGEGLLIAGEGSEPEICETCGSNPCTCEKEEETSSPCEICGQAPCTCKKDEEPTICEVCNADPCTCEEVEPTVSCETCGSDPCTCEPVEVCDNCALTLDLCTCCDECGFAAGHSTDCSQNVAPASCNCESVDGSHAETCPMYVCPDCETTGGEHTETCITNCICETVPADGEKHTNKECPFYVKECSCGTETLFHVEGCDFYVEPVTAMVYAEVDGRYTEIEGHGETVPIDVEEYDSQTVYVLVNDAPQNIYFERIYEAVGGLFGTYGANYSISETDYAELSVSNEASAGTYKNAMVVLAAETPANTEITLVAEHALWGENTVKIMVVDELPEKEPSEVETVVNGTSIKVSGDDIPATVTLEAATVAAENYREDIADYIENLDDLLFAFDIKLMDGASEHQLGGTVTVTLDVSDMGLEDGQKIGILHDHGDAPEKMGKHTVTDGQITFETDSFSVFYFYLIFEFDGFEFILSGGSEVYLSELMMALGIDRDVTDVAQVTFSDETLVVISQEGTDWLITSLEPFGSEEYLTIIFDDGEEIVICVTDPVIYNYAVDKKITNVPLLDTEQATMGTVTDGDTFSEGRTFTVNTVPITMADLQAAGTIDKAATATHMVVYAAEGMAIRFEAGTNWPKDTSRPGHDTNGIWYWSWDSTNNHAIIEDGAAGKHAFIPLNAVVDGTTYYCNVMLVVVENSEPTLLEENLPEGYVIKNVPATLYNYDGKTFNEYYNDRGGNYFAFSGVSKGVSSTTNADHRGWTSSGLQANGGGGVALMGILADELDDNSLPVMSQGQKVDLFSTSEDNGKEVFENVGFQFVYNESTGYYSYNSALNHAQFNESENEIQLYKQSLAASDTVVGASHGNAGFYPFEDIKNAFTNSSYEGITEEQWKKKLEENAFELIPSQYSSDIVATGSTNTASTVDMHFGLQIDSEFYLPEGKKLNNQDMVYEFTGDDDLWVFIDGQLVLDIGGGHTYVSGSFNLTTGEIWVEKYTQLAAADGGSYETRKQGTNLKEESAFLKNLADDQMHTIQIFYLERHSGVSNCRMHFNLPLAPTNGVEVSKTLVNQDGDTLSVTPDVEYTFQIFTAADDDDNIDATADAFQPLANKEYLGGTTNANGEFTLKAGQRAIFDGIPRFTEVYVVELKPEDHYDYTARTVSINGEAATGYTFEGHTDTKVVQLDSPMTFDFTNYMQTQPLTIEKKVVGDAGGLLNPEQMFTFGLDFTKSICEISENAIFATNGVETVTLTDGGSFALKQGESLTIPRVPVNMTFTLSETNPDSTDNSFDVPVFDAEIGTSTETTAPTSYAFDTPYGWKMNNGGENKLLVINQQRFNLTITKSGIDDVDHDSDEKQSTIYLVTGPNDFKMEVVICGNESATIVKLPVGQYTVKELVDWSWRYEVNADEEIEKTIKPDEFTETAAYTNNRQEHLWISGDCYVENWFSTEGIKKRDGENVEIQ